METLHLPQQTKMPKSSNQYTHYVMIHTIGNWYSSHEIVKLNEKKWTQTKLLMVLVLILSPPTPLNVCSLEIMSFSNESDFQSLNSPLVKWYMVESQAYTI